MPVFPVRCPLMYTGCSDTQAALSGPSDKRTALDNGRPRLRIPSGGMHNLAARTMAPAPVAPRAVGQRAAAPREDPMIFFRI